MNWLDDKAMVILAVTLLGAGLVLFDPLPAENASILNSIVSGLFGIAVGRGIK